MSTNAAITILGHPGSTCTRRVLYTAALLNIPIKLQTVDFLKGEQKHPQHIQKQPFGKIPVLEQGDFVLYESRAICRYLNDGVSTTHSLIPQEPKAKAIFEQWASLELGTFNPLIETLNQHTVYYKFQPGGKADEAVRDATYEKLQTPLKVLDAQLAKHSYITGDHISLVDIWIVPALYTIHEHAPEEAKKVMGFSPNIAAWWKRVTTTPEWQEIDKHKLF